MSLPSTALKEEFAPKLWTVLQEGYGLSDLRADMLAGLTVAIVALPLSMAIAIAIGRWTGTRSIHRHCRRFSCVPAGGIAVPGWRTGGRIYRSGVGHRHANRA